MPYFTEGFRKRNTSYNLTFVSQVHPRNGKIFKMARVLLLIAMASFIGLTSAQSSFTPSFFYPVEHRSDRRVLHNRAADTAYEVKVLSSSQQELQPEVEYNPANVSLVSLLWDYLPSPIIVIKTVFKAIVTKVLKLVKFLLPLELVILGMGSVVGFCALTPYCTMVIEEPIANKLRAIRSSIPYIDDLEYYVNEAIHRVQELQRL